MERRRVRVLWGQSEGGGKIRSKLPEPLLINVDHELETLEEHWGSAVHSCIALNDFTPIN